MPRAISISTDGMADGRLGRQVTHHLQIRSRIERGQIGWQETETRVIGGIAKHHDGQAGGLPDRLADQRGTDPQALCTRRDSDRCQRKGRAVACHGRQRDVTQDRAGGHGDQRQMQIAVCAQLADQPRFVFAIERRAQQGVDGIVIGAAFGADPRHHVAPVEIASDRGAGAAPVAVGGAGLMCRESVGIHEQLGQVPDQRVFVLPQIKSQAARFAPAEIGMIGQQRQGRHHLRGIGTDQTPLQRRHRTSQIDRAAGILAVMFGACVVMSASTVHDVNLLIRAMAAAGLRGFSPEMT